MTLVVAVLLACFGAPLPAADQELVFTWRMLSSGDAILELQNSQSAQQWDATVRALEPPSPAPPELVVEPARVEVKPAQTVAFKFRLGPKERPSPGADFRYAFTLQKSTSSANQGGSSARGNRTPQEPAVERRIIRIQPTYRLPPQPLPSQPQGRYVFTATRAVPFISPWVIEAALPLAAPPELRSLTVTPRQPLGVLHATGSGLEHSALVRLGDSQSSSSLPLELEFPVWASAKLIGTLTLPDGQSREVIVQTADHVFYPLAVILIGVVVAFRVKRYVTQRPIAVLQATLADTEARLRVVDAEFERKVTGRLSTDMAVLPAWRQFRTDAEAELVRVRTAGGTLDRNNAAFTSLETRINATGKLPAQWAALGMTLLEVDAVRREIASLNPPAGMTDRPRIEEELADAARGSVLPTIQELDVVGTQVQGTLTTARSWLRAWNDGARLKLLRLPPAAAAAIEQAQQVLWLGSDQSEITQAKALLDQARKTIVSGGAAAAARRETAVAAARAAAPEASIVTPEAAKLQRDDRLALCVALALAVLVGLNAEYFGKPFGSLGDYARVLAWALTSSIGVDIASLALDRIASGSGGARAITRA